MFDRTTRPAAPTPRDRAPDAYGLDFADAEPAAPAPPALPRADVKPDARRVALDYRALLDWSEELGFTAACAELPQVTARSASADQCVQRLYAALADEIARELSHGRRPRPPQSCSVVRPAHPPTAMRLVTEQDAGAPGGRPSGDAPIPPTAFQLWRMAKWTAGQYRLVLHARGGAWHATCPEAPDVTGAGRTPGKCVADVRRRLATFVTALIESNQMPPEPLQDVERRAATIAGARPRARLAA